MVGLNDLEGLLQPKRFHDYMAKLYTLYGYEELKIPKI